MTSMADIQWLHDPGRKIGKKNGQGSRDRDEDGDGVVGSSSDREVEQSNMVKLKKAKFMIPMNDDWIEAALLLSFSEVSVAE